MKSPTLLHDRSRFVEGVRGSMPFWARQHGSASAPDSPVEVPGNPASGSDDIVERTDGESPPNAPTGWRHSSSGNSRYPFATSVDMCVMDSAGFPEPPWSARSKELSRNDMVIASRRMCYVGAQVIVLIHLIDSEPVAVCGAIERCEYDCGGQYRLVVGLRERIAKPQQIEELFQTRSIRPGAK